MFIGYSDIQDFENNFVIYQLEILMKDIDISKYNTLEFDMKNSSLSKTIKNCQLLFICV